MKQATPVICIMGPTASGKTRLAIELAQRLPCEIISVDSAMVYRGMDIGTAKPTADELAQTPHRLIDICDPAQVYSAGQFREDALREIANIVQQKCVPLLVGGTMLYYHVLQHGLAALPTADTAVRDEITLQAEREGWESVHQRLCAVDPKAGARIHPNDAQRIQRALEVFLLTGKTLTELTHTGQKNNDHYQWINLALMPADRRLLQERIAARFRDMLAKGLVDEVAKLMQRGDLSPDLPSMRSVGYNQVWDYLMGKLTYANMEELGIIATRQLAKRQLTWLRRWKNVNELNSDETGLINKTLKILNVMLYPTNAQ